jgi:predicted PurR-regulated permease PerM
MTPAGSPRPGATPFSKRLLAIAALLLMAFVAWRLADLLVIVFGATVLAVALRLVTQQLERLGVPQRWSLLLTVMLIVVALALGAWWLGAPLAEQLAKLRERLPAAGEAVLRWLHGHRVGQLVLDVWNDASGNGVPWSNVAGIATTTLGMLGDAALIVILGIYLAAAPATYRNGLVRLVPVPYRERVTSALQASGQALHHWLLGQALSMAFVGFSTALGLWLLGIPLALAIGLISGLIAFVPFFGAIAGGLLAVLLAFTEGPRAALHVALLCVAIQQIEGHVLMPLAQKWAVQLPPALAIAAAVVFGMLFGFVGVLFATPLMVVTVVMVQRLYVEAFLEQRTAP